MSVPPVTRHALHSPRRRGGLTDAEVAFVETRRASRVSWGAIARQLGRCEHDVRVVCDGDYEEER
jgi:hypothetical protein